MAQSQVAQYFDCYIEERLEEWGRWARQGESAGLYYPSRSNVGKIMDSGATFIDRSFHGIEENPRAEEIDRLVCMYAKTHDLGAKILFIYYVQSKPRELVMSNLKITLAMFYDRMKMAKSWLEGCLSSKL